MSPITGDLPLITLSVANPLASDVSITASKTGGSSRSIKKGDSASVLSSSSRSIISTVQLRLRPDLTAADAVESAFKNLATTFPGLTAEQIPNKNLCFIFEVGGNLRKF